MGKTSTVKVKSKANNLKLEYVPGSVNEYRLWDANDNYPQDQSDVAGYERARKINRFLQGKA